MKAGFLFVRFVRKCDCDVKLIQRMTSDSGGIEKRRRRIALIDNVQIVSRSANITRRTIENVECLTQRQKRKRINNQSEVNAFPFSFAML